MHLLPIWSKWTGAIPNLTETTVDGCLLARGCEDHLPQIPGRDGGIRRLASVGPLGGWRVSGEIGVPGDGANEHIVKRHVFHPYGSKQQRVELHLGELGSQELPDASEIHFSSLPAKLLGDVRFDLESVGPVEVARRLHFYSSCLLQWETPATRQTPRLTVGVIKSH